ncbi:hypothetical protein [Nonomuraea rubra]|uniref:Uncharacterized protein n=1 Tax=Nonomuraea rubra TaxID=46180 RepID=A0A7X0U020_9ACTN|nr:hypothetical protein [Nonomuraea rubra]MBB6550171.1 hypothetical protein [Nonomuraea rubra]
MDAPLDLAQIAQRFPLTARPIPLYRPLQARIDEVLTLARTTYADEGSPVLPDGQPAKTEIAAMPQRYLAFKPADELIVFRTRLGLAVIDFASGPSRQDAKPIAAMLVDDILTTQDGYAAQDMLATRHAARLSRKRACSALTTAAQAAGLGTDALPTHSQPTFTPQSRRAKH